MPNRWTCLDHPASHKSFPQWALDDLAREFPELQPRNRYACPQCWAKGDEGWMRPTEVARAN